MKKRRLQEETESNNKLEGNANTNSNTATSSGIIRDRDGKPISDSCASQDPRSITRITRQ